jgi:hypothetical protein
MKENGEHVLPLNAKPEINLTLITTIHILLTGNLNTSMFSTHHKTFGSDTVTRSFLFQKQE